MNQIGSISMNNNNYCVNPIKIVQMNNMINNNNLYNSYCIGNKINNNEIKSNMNNKYLYNSFDKEIIRNIYNNLENTNITIDLLSSKGTNTSLSVPSNITIQDLYKIYAAKNGVDEKLLGNKINFIYKASTMTVNDQRKLSEVFRNDYSKVTVIDTT